MNISEFAKMLDCRGIGNEISEIQAIKAKELGFVVVFGYSDDNAEFRGALDEEVGCYNGSNIYLDGNKLLENCEEECSHWQKAKENSKTIEAVWNDETGPCWSYETDIPHAEFDVIDEDGVWCKGIVFDINNLG